MRLRSHLMNVVVAALAVLFTVWWFEPGRPAPADEACATMRRALRPEMLLPQSLQGTVVDEAGAPVGDVWIAGIHAGTAGTLASTFRDGRFAIDRGYWSGFEPCTEIYAFHPQFDVAHEWLPWGRDDLRLVMHPHVPIELRLVDENGERVRAVGATCHWHPRLAPDASTWLGAEGDVLRGGAFRGTNYLSIELAQGGTVAHEAIKRRAITVAGTGPVQLTVVAVTMRPQEVRVVAPDGVPVADACVELIDQRDRAVTAYDQTDCDLDGPIRVGMATTDALGTARPLGPVGRPLVVRATRRGFSGFVADVRVPGSEVVVVRLAPRAECSPTRGHGLLRRTSFADLSAMSVGPHIRRPLGTVTGRGGETTTAAFVVPDDVPR